MFSLRHPSLQNRAGKKRLNVIIVAEGAIDHSNTPITTDYIKDVSTELCVKVWPFPPPRLPPVWPLPLFCCPDVALTLSVFLKCSVRCTLSFGKMAFTQLKSNENLTPRHLPNQMSCISFCLTKLCGWFDWGHCDTVCWDLAPNICSFLFDLLSSHGLLFQLARLPVTLPTS